VVTPNLDQLRIFCKRPELNQTMRAKATLMLADGMPLVWASRLQGTPLPERVAGSEIIFSLTAAAAEAEASIFFSRWQSGYRREGGRAIGSANPGLKIAGILCPAMGFEKDAAMMAVIKEEVLAAKPDLVYCCFGFQSRNG